MLQLPKFAPSRVRTMAESEAKAYHELATAYGTHSAEKLGRCIEQYSAAYNAVGVGKLEGRGRAGVVRTML